MRLGRKSPDDVVLNNMSSRSHAQVYAFLPTQDQSCLPLPAIQIGYPIPYVSYFLFDLGVVHVHRCLWWST